jgi:hypothetical protein
MSDLIPQSGAKRTLSHHRRMNEVCIRIEISHRSEALTWSSPLRYAVTDSLVSGSACNSVN